MSWADLPLVLGDLGVFAARISCREFAQDCAYLTLGGVACLGHEQSGGLV